jgi:hypothetical protein
MEKKQGYGHLKKDIVGIPSDSSADPERWMLTAQSTIVGVGGPRLVQTVMGTGGVKPAKTRGLGNTKVLTDTQTRVQSRPCEKARFPT